MAVRLHSIDSEAIAGIECIRLRAPDATMAEIVPAWGGSCMALRIGDLAVLDAAPFEEIARKPTAYGIPILFPFPNRIRDGRFAFDGREYPVDPPRHGLVRDKPWTVVGRGASETEGAWVTVALDARDHERTILACFPFPFRIAVTYRLRANALELTAAASNTGDRAMPAGFGIHPYFHAPDGATVSVPAERRWELVDSLPTGRTLAVDGRYDLRRPRPIAGLELDDVYTALAADADGRVRCVIDDPSVRRTVIEVDPRALPEVVVYTPPPPRAAICVEPQSCPTDAFNLAARGMDAHVVRLAPGEEARWSIIVRSESIQDSGGSP